MTAKHTGIRTFEIVQYVTGFLEGSMDDWPAQIQDVVYKALERKSHEVELPLAIVHSRCDVDHDAVDAQHKFYLHIIASEVVVADERTLNPGTVVR